MKERELRLIMTWFILTWVFMLILSIFGCKDEAEARAKAIYNSALTDTEVAQIYDDPFYEPNEPSELIIHCYCGLQYKVLGKDICFSQSVSLVTEVSEPNEPEIGYICPHCKQHNAEYLLKCPDPVVLERKVGAVIQVNYRLYCVHCDKEV